MKKLLLFLGTLSFVFATVDINTATTAELSKIKGIGDKKAQSIIDYRAIHCFNSVDELKLVKGIGEKSLEKIRGELSASECK